MQNNGYNLENLFLPHQDLGNRVSAELENLLRRPHWFVRELLLRVKEIPSERVSQIVQVTGAPVDTRGRTKSINIRGLTNDEKQFILKEIERVKSLYGDTIQNIRDIDSEIFITIKPEVGYLADSLLQSPWEFVRAIAGMAGINDEERVTQIVLNTIAPHKDNGITQSITIENLGEVEVNALSRVITELRPAIEDQVEFTLGFHVNEERKVDQISLTNIIGQPEIINVKQGQFTVSETQVQTAGLDTCTAVGIRFEDGFNFLAHIDATTDTHYMKSSVIRKLSEGTKVVSYKVWCGSGMIGQVGVDLSKAKADEVLNLIPSYDSSTSTKVTFNDKVGITKSGQFYP